MFLLRATQIGLKLTDLDLLEYGTVIDMFTEAANDQFDYPIKAGQADFDKF